MKRISFRLLAISVFLICQFRGFSQVGEDQPGLETPVPKWVSARGYWVTQTTRQDPGKCVIYFYTNDHKLVYREETSGIIFNLQKSAKPLLNLEDC